MTRPFIPPRGVFIPTRLIFDPKLPSTVRDTLVQLMALAWRSPTHELPPLSFPQLVKLTGKSHTTLHNHFAILKAYHSALRLRVTGDGLFIVTIADRFYEVTGQSKNGIPNSGGVKEDDHDQKEEEEEENLPLLPDDHDHDQDLRTENPLNLAETSDFEGLSLAEAPKALEEPTPKSPEAERSLPKGLKKELIEVGVFSFLLPEVARSGRNSRNLLALLTWCEEDDPEKPGRLFMARLRLGVEVPARYFGKRCPECHRVGKHTDRCSRRYTQWVTG